VKQCIKVTQDRLIPLMRAGRSRWKIENDPIAIGFNTLKNLGYHFTHNFEYGDDHLSIFHTTLMKSMNNIYLHAAKLYGFKLKINSL